MDQVNSGTMYIVATPIGNLEDITLRALRILKEVDTIACEDTRVTSKLLQKYEISKPLISYHQHSKIGKIDKIIEILKTGKNVAVVTDAGTPGVADPGNVLVAEVVKNGIKIEPIPGPSAIASLVSVSGIDMQKFTFMGFPPHKKGRETFFNRVAESDLPIVYYDSVHRVLKNLKFFEEKNPEAQIILGRELTKMYEEVVRGSIQEVIEYFVNNSDKVKGEFIIIVKN